MTKKGVYVLQIDVVNWSDQPRMLMACIDYFEKIFSDNGEGSKFFNLLFEGPKIPKDDNVISAHPPSIEAIHRVVFSLKSDKTLGSDGFSVDFFKCYWEIIKSDIISTVRDLF